MKNNQKLLTEFRLTFKMQIKNALMSNNYYLLILNY